MRRDERRSRAAVMFVALVLLTGLVAASLLSRSGEPDPDPRAAWTGTAGTQGVSCPAGAPVVEPGQDIQTALERAGSGATVCIRGEHRLTRALAPRTGQHLVGEGAILTGTKVLSEWEPEGSFWRIGAQTQSFPSTTGEVCERNPIACEAEDVFIDDLPLVRVPTKAALAPGRFYFDEAADTIWIADDPTGHELEASAAEDGISAGGVPNVTIEGLVVEKFAANGIEASSGWTITRNEIRWNHSHGLRFGQVVTHNLIHHNGNMGLFGQGTGMRYEQNELAYNNYLNFGKASGGYWHAGATKIVKSSDVVVLNNYSHHNTGDGWWMDWDNIRIRIEGNLFEANARSGLFYEASFDGVIANNLFRDNGLGQGEQVGSGLFINSSKNVQVLDNTFVGNLNAIGAASLDRGTSTYGVRETANLTVRSNTVLVRAGGTAITIPWGDTSFPSASASFEANTYLAPDTTSRWWDWVGGAVAWSGWRSLGFDAEGSLRAG